LAYFHAIIQDRRKFGSIGWNIRYEFTTEDYDVCKRQLKIFLDTNEIIPYRVLNFVFAEINYGGRVTDYIDVRLMNNIINTYIRPEVLNPNFSFSSSGIYKSIEG
jgi:dynein heavy chain, axonemal